MMRWTNLVFGAAAFVAAAGFVVPPPAQAGFSMTLQEGSSTTTITWGVTPGQNAIIGGVYLLNFGPGSFGDFSFLSIQATSTSYSAALNGNLADVSIAVQYLSSNDATKSLIVTATDDGFTFPYSKDTVASTGSASIFPFSAPGTMAFDGLVHNAFDSVAPPSFVLNPSAHGGVDSTNPLGNGNLTSPTPFNPNFTPYTITTTLTFAGLQADGSQFLGASGNSEVQGVPEPATLALALGGLCFAGGGHWLRRKYGKRAP